MNLKSNAFVCIVHDDSHCDVDMVGSIVCPDAVDGYHHLFEYVVYVNVVIPSVRLCPVNF